MTKIETKTIEPILVVSIEGTGQIPDFNKDVDRLYSYLYNYGFKDKIAGPLIGLFFTEFGGKYIVAIPIKEIIPVKNDTKIAVLSKIKCISKLHKGSYRTIEEAFDRLKKYLTEKHLEFKFTVREIYINNTGKEEDYLTEVQIPL